MKKRFRVSLLFLLFTLLGGVLTLPVSGTAGTEEFHRPRLVVLVVVDGLSWEEWRDIQPLLGKSGFRRLEKRGARLSRANYDYASTVTAAGHATLVTGASPARHGVIANEWMDAASREEMYCTEDSAHRFLPPEVTKKHDGTSPRNLKVSTLGDELLRQTQNKARVFAFSGKDRAAILTAGKNGTAYFYNRRSGRFVTSDYYRKEYPKWWLKFHEDLPQDKWFGKAWTPVLALERYKHPETANRKYASDFKGLGGPFPQRITGGLNAPGPDYYRALSKTPYSDDYLAAFAKAAIMGEGIGRNPSGSTDFLTLSFSSHDLVNHSFGPESVQSQDSLLRLDKTLARFFHFLDTWVPEKQRVIIFTADHGFEKTPEYLAAQGLSTGRLNMEELKDSLNKHLSGLFGEGGYVLSWYLPTFYLDPRVIQEKKLKASGVEKAAADFLAKEEGIAEVFTRTEFEEGRLPQDDAARMAAKSWDSQRSGDLFLIPKEGWYFYEPPHRVIATHGSPYPADTHVPLIFWGPMFEKGVFEQAAAIEDVVTTLAKVLKIEPPETAEGEVLDFILRPASAGHRSQKKAPGPADGSQH